MPEKRQRRKQQPKQEIGGGKRKRWGEEEEVVEEGGEEEYVPVEERCVEEEEEGNVGTEESGTGENEVPDDAQSMKKPHKAVTSKRAKQGESDQEARLVGIPVEPEEARRRWPERYEEKKKIQNGINHAEEEAPILAQHHYLQGEVDGYAYSLDDTAFVQSEEGKLDYICRIVEFFEGMDNKPYFVAQWFYRPEDTIIKDSKLKGLHDPRRVFISDIKDINPLGCIVSKVTIERIVPNINLKEKEKSIPPCHFYYDMSYSVPYSTFMSLPAGIPAVASEPSSSMSSVVSVEGANGETRFDSEECSLASRSGIPELSCLDLYSGCGGMSTGLCLGANLAGAKLVTRWAVDLNEYACKSLKINHPETQVRNESAEDFLSLLKEWENLCSKFSLIGTDMNCIEISDSASEDEKPQETVSGGSSEEFEVEKFVGIRFGELPNSKKRGVMLKVHWKGYNASEDTWEPLSRLGNCQERIEAFVAKGYKTGILPLPGNVDVICGGPPCQGISGFNRFRNGNEPLKDPKNKQMVVYMDIVNFIKPKYVLMENVVDILRFANGFLGRYALSRLVEMNYQARLGIMAAGSYGLPQFRMRAFLWGAQPTKILPQFPLPTHDVVIRGGAPNEFEPNIVAYDGSFTYSLEKKLLLEDAISDLPPVTNFESRDEMAYGKSAKTDFQQFIRLKKNECWNSEEKAQQNRILYDHRPLCLNTDDFSRVCRIPKNKGANFRNLPGVMLGPDNKVEWDPNVAREYLPSGKPLVPDYAMSFVKGRSQKPFGRLWWDETVPTVVTRAEPHNQIILHPEQDRVLSIRENARLQGFSDYYQLVGPVKERYIQVGNAVAVPVARALGYSLGMAIRRIGDEQPVTKLPEHFPLHKAFVGIVTVD